MVTPSQTPLSWIHFFQQQAKPLPIPSVPMAARPSISQMLPPASSMFTGECGENIYGGAAVTVGTDGKFYLGKYDPIQKSDDVVFGFAANSGRAGNQITLFAGIRWNYHPEIKPGIKCYLSPDEPGRLTTVLLENQIWLGFGLDHGRMLLRASF